MTETSKRTGREVSEGTPRVLREYTVQGKYREWNAYYKVGQTITGDGDGGGGTKTTSDTVDIGTESSLIK